MKEKDAADLGPFINVGTGKDISIRELAEMIAEIVGYDGEVIWDTSKPNGTPRKLMDVGRISIHFSSSIRVHELQMQSWVS
jgi:GDP-L-fucose synthase